VVKSGLLVKYSEEFGNILKNLCVNLCKNKKIKTAQLVKNNMLNNASYKDWLQKVFLEINE
jgi:hypothetical protein